MAAAVLGLAGVSLLVGGWWLDGFLVALGLAALVDFGSFTLGRQTREFRYGKLVVGALHVGLGVFFLTRIEGSQVFVVASAVIAFQATAVFIDRRAHGRKLAPRLDPSRSWRGFGIGAIAASFMLLVTSQLYATPLCRWYYDARDSFGPPLPAGTFMFDDRCHIWSPPVDFRLAGTALLAGLIYAIVAQAGELLARLLIRGPGPSDRLTLNVGRGGLTVLMSGLFAVATVGGTIAMVLT